MTGRKAPATYGIWFLIRLPLLLGCAVGIIATYGTRSIVPCIVTAALAFATALLDAWVLRVRRDAEPVEDGGVRPRSTLDTWQPVAAFAWLSQVGHLLDGSLLQHVVLAVLGVGACVVIVASRRAYV